MMKYTKAISLLAMFCFQNWISITEALECDGQLLVNAVCLPRNYSKEETPSPPPVKATGKFASIEILRLNLKEQTMTLAIEVGLGWADDRIKINSTALSSSEGSVPVRAIKDSDGFLLWKPVLKVANLVSINFNSLLEDPKYILVGFNDDTNKTLVIYELMLQVEVSCQMKFDDFPFDVQICPLTIGDRLHIVDFTNVHFANFDLKNQKLQDYDVSATEFQLKNSNGTFVINMGLKLIFERFWKPFVLKYHAPCAIIVTVCHISYLVPPNIAPGRIALLVTNFLALSNIFSSHQAETPVSRRATALAIYILACIMFVFMALMGYAFILYNMRMVPEKIDNSNSSARAWTDDKKKGQSENKDEKFKTQDKIMLLVSALAFAIFNSIYFGYFLAKGE